MAAGAAEGTGDAGAGAGGAAGGGELIPDAANDSAADAAAGDPAADAAAGEGTGDGAEEGDLIGAEGDPAEGDAAASQGDQEGEQDGGESDAEEAWEFQGRPEDGYAELEPTEGVSYAQEAVDHFLEFAGKLNGGKGLSQGDAQALFQYESQRMLDAVALQQSQLAQLNRGWADEIRKDPALGGDNLRASNRVVLHAFQEVPGGKEALAEVRKLGIQRNPALFRLMHAVGKMIGEDGHFVADGGESGGGPSRPNLEKTYPSMKGMNRST